MTEIEFAVYDRFLVFITHDAAKPAAFPDLPLMKNMNFWKKNSVLQWGAESAPARMWLTDAGGNRTWEARTGSWQIQMCGDIFAAARLWRGRLLTTGCLSSRHPVVVCAGRVVKVAVAVRLVPWACSGRDTAICVRGFSSVSHL